ncbi:substrate-binding domain-containing protein [Sedimentitalea sp. JM2-8]|uniref:Substrate-binding domain-containing protein n=1 Tax=Sedimentitalea xiamensis TaxID=3050037 RepID=A0ABT7FFK4_9RHOB|nr:substrate-binding domain-containing protein [Sedimentitalea xiamensis]MDK3073892.1 substrate-binding domain-containing protein [Sedimentitalea xiamensis]
MPAWGASGTVVPILAAALWVLGPDTGLSQTSDLVSKTAFRVCADPANDPMSSKQETGYENRLADLFAGQLGLPVEYTWYPMATGFIRNTLRDNKCDVVIGYAQGHELVLNTNHYFTSAYTLVTRKGSPIDGVDTLSDPRLKGTHLGVVAGSPPATHMARNGLIAGARPYDLMVDRRHESPILDMLNDLNAGELDGALLWGPISGPLVKAGYPDLVVTPLIKETLPPRLFFRITMGVRQGEKVWARKLNSLIRRNQAEIDAILTEAGVPLLNDMGTGPLGEAN